jgi:WD40 repeat protein
MTAGPSSASERRVAAGCTNGELIIWDTATGRELRVIRGHTSNVRSVAWSPDGRRIASGGYDRFVKIWDTQSGRELISLTAHRASVDCVAWSPSRECLDVRPARVRHGRELDSHGWRCRLEVSRLPATAISPSRLASPTRSGSALHRSIASRSRASRKRFPWGFIASCSR